jgi:long-subunit fatty acid transport protein
MISAGIKYQSYPGYRFAGLLFFRRNANFGKTLDSTDVLVDNDVVIDKNTYEIALGLEYDITEKLLISGGYLFAKSGVSEDYQTDMSFDLSSSTYGIGFCYKFNENLKVDVGGAYTLYNEGEKNYVHGMDEVGIEVPAKYSYYMDNIIFGIGVEFGF